MWIAATSLEAVREARSKNRGVYCKETSPAVAIFASRADELFAVDAACPHAGHRLSSGHCLDPTDIEDLLDGAGVVVSCPAHSYVYDLRSGDCVSALGGGPGRCVKRPVKLEGDVVYVRTDQALPTTSLDVPVEHRNQISLRIVDHALDAKYGAA
mmetsp:Transcript_2642/g.8263  ORF Transcript_2642/g.8263 Transcript_2642/m.8263 type:complete len:155 (-) Transcript_2642:1002-1466(-)